MRIASTVFSASHNHWVRESALVSLEPMKANLAGLTPATLSKAFAGDL